MPRRDWMRTAAWVTLVFVAGLLLGRQFPVPRFALLPGAKTLLDRQTGRICLLPPEPEDPFASYGSGRGGLQSSKPGLSQPSAGEREGPFTRFLPQPKTFLYPYCSR